MRASRAHGIIHGFVFAIAPDRENQEAAIRGRTLGWFVAIMPDRENQKATIPGRTFQFNFDFLELSK
ncbi:hypothetical protein [Rudaea sp.]|uniref:hypothetical protein n=1 Tax=Rudaea sp. TaxID=2136325 RepID=UPI0037838A19